MDPSSRSIAATSERPRRSHHTLNVVDYRFNPDMSHADRARWGISSRRGATDGATGPSASCLSLQLWPVQDV
jgi:hypothetical protein